MSSHRTTQLKRDGTDLTPVLALAHSSTPHTPGTWQVHHKLGFKRQMDEVTKGRLNPPATSSGTGPQDELHKNAESQGTCTNLGQGDELLEPGQAGEKRAGQRTRRIQQPGRSCAWEKRWPQWDPVSSAASLCVHGLLGCGCTGLAPWERIELVKNSSGHLASWCR